MKQISDMTEITEDVFITTVITQFVEQMVQGMESMQMITIERRGKKTSMKTSCHFGGTISQILNHISTKRNTKNKIIYKEICSQKTLFKALQLLLILYRLNRDRSSNDGRRWHQPELMFLIQSSGSHKFSSILHKSTTV